MVNGKKIPARFYDKGEQIYIHFPNHNSKMKNEVVLLLIP